jgi:hypothetical protein
MNRLIFLMVLFLIPTIAFCGVGAGFNITFGAPWDNDVELQWGYGLGVNLFLDLLRLPPLSVQACGDSHYLYWSNVGSQYLRDTEDEWVFEFAEFFVGARAIFNPFDDSVDVPPHGIICGSRTGIES